jgi:anti-sigma B factor antagonist
MKEIAWISVETHDAVPVARVEGEVDMTNAESIGERLRGLLTNRSESLIVDLGATTYLDSTGIAVLFAIGEELRRRQQQLHLVVPEDSPLRRVIGIAGLDRAVPIHSTLATALGEVR